MQFLYIFEDGAMAVCDDAPTRVDVGMIADGCLQVICGSGFKDFNDDGTLEDLPACVLVEDENGAYHVPSA